MSFRTFGQTKMSDSPAKGGRGDGDPSGTVFVDSFTVPANASWDSIVPVIRLEKSADEYYRQLETEEKKEQRAYGSEGSASGMHHPVPTSDGEVNRNFGFNGSFVLVKRLDLVDNMP